GVLVHQVLRALQLDLAEGLRRLAALERALRLLDRGFVQTLLDTIERRAFLDRVALLEQHFFQEARHPRADLDFIDGIDAPDEIERIGDRSLLDLDDADRDGGGLLLLSVGGQNEAADDESGAKPSNVHVSSPRVDEARRTPRGKSNTAPQRNGAPS